MIWDKYQERINAIPKEQFNERVYVDTQIKDFVGTQEHINAERMRLAAEAKSKTTITKAAYNKAYQDIINEYMEELFQGYTTPQAVLDKAYSIAYDRGHSAGYAEVEGIFYDMVADLIDIYDLGLKDGASGKQ